MLLSQSEGYNDKKKMRRMAALGWPVDLLNALIV